MWAFFGFVGAENVSRTGSKTDPEKSPNKVRFWGPFWVPLSAPWATFGSLLALLFSRVFQDSPKTAQDSPRQPQDSPKTAQDRPKTDSRETQESPESPGASREPQESDVFPTCKPENTYWGQTGPPKRQGSLTACLSLRKTLRERLPVSPQAFSIILSV